MAITKFVPNRFIPTNALYYIFQTESAVETMTVYPTVETFVAQATAENGLVLASNGALVETATVTAGTSGAGAALIEGGGVGAETTALKVVSSELVEGGAVQTVTKGIASKIPTILIGASITIASGLAWSAYLADINPTYISELEALMEQNGTTPVERAWVSFLKGNKYYVNSNVAKQVIDYNMLKGCYEASGFTPIAEDALQFNTPLTINTISWADFFLFLDNFFLAQVGAGHMSLTAYTNTIAHITNSYANDVVPWLNGRQCLIVAQCDNEGFNVEGGDRFNFYIYFYVADANGKFMFAPDIDQHPSLTFPFIFDYNTGAFEGTYYFGYPDEYDARYERAWEIGIYYRGNDVRSTWSRGDVAVFGGLYYIGTGRYVWSNAGTISSGGGQIGVTQQSGATLPSDTDWTFENTYPDWWNDRIQISKYNPTTGENEIYTYLPLQIQITDPTLEGTGTQTQDDAQSGAISDEDTQEGISDGVIELAQEQVDEETDIPTDVDTPTDTGATPTIPLPFDISGNGMIMVYNPTKTELQSISSWLWTSNVFVNLAKIFNDPMQAIISLHVLYAKPIISSNKTDVKIGFLDSGVDSYYVTEQYVEIDCGSVTLNEYFGNYMDYDFTEVYLHLPFVGIVQLKTTDVMRSIIHVKYKVDVVSGCCLCNVSIEKNDMDAILYTYSGNCSVPIPYSASNYANMITGLLGVTGATVSAVASGGATIALSSSIALGSLGNALHRDISHGGSLSGNAGAMGVKKPYLIVNRHIPYYSERQKQYDGLPSNEYVKLGDCVGFTKIKEVHLLNLNATDEETNMIDEQLKGGVIL